MSDYSISSTSTSNISDLLYASKSKNKDKFKESMDALTTAVNNGDLTTAASTLEEIQKNAPKDGGNKEANKAFTALQDAVKSGDAAKAKEALANLQEVMKKNKPQGNPPPKPSDDSSGSDGDSDDSSGLGSVFNAQA